MLVVCPISGCGKWDRFLKKFVRKTWIQSINSKHVNPVFNILYFKTDSLYRRANAFKTSASLSQSPPTQLSITACQIIYRFSQG